MGVTLTHQTHHLPFTMSAMRSSHSVLLLLACLALAVSARGIDGTHNLQCKQADDDRTLRVFHVYSECSPFRPKKSLSWEDSVLKMEADDQSRLLYLSSLVARKSVVTIAQNRPTYIVSAKIGTPPQTLLMAMDTSNDAAWIPCTGCVGCSSSLFRPNRSSTFKPVGCGNPQCKQVPNPSCGGRSCVFNMTYGGSSLAANLSRDVVTLARDPIPGYTFGCLQKTTGSSVPAQGLLGLGRGPLSLLSQSQSLYKSTFSYCLPSFKNPNSTGTLRLGPVYQPKKIKYTPILTNPRRSSLYYVNLERIRVGSTIVKIPPKALAFDKVTGAGTIIDSGTVFTRLVLPAYTAVRDEFRRHIKGKVPITQGGFDTCYTGAIVAPTITLMFTGMNVTLPVENLMLHSTNGNFACLAMAAAPDNVNSVLNVIASMQQQNHRLLFDLPNSRLGVARETCT